MPSSNASKPIPMRVAPWYWTPHAVSLLKPGLKGPASVKSPKKPAIYGALLGESLERLNVTVARVRAFKNKPDKTLQSRAQAWFGFYLANPRDLDLGFYLVQGMKPRGLTQALNTQLNERLHDALRPCETALRDMGLGAAEALCESTALFAHGVGLLLLQHTGRIRMFGQSAQDLFGRYLSQLVARCHPGDGAGPGEMPEPGASESGDLQADLFA